MTPPDLNQAALEAANLAMGDWWGNNDMTKGALAVHVIRAYLAALPPSAGEWRPIKDCPRNTMVEVYIPKPIDESAPNFGYGKFSVTANGKLMWIINGQFGFDIGLPSHFRIPAPPATGRDGE